MTALARITQHSNSDCDRSFDPDPLEAELEVSTEEINIVVAQLKRITRSANLEFALRVGALIIHHFHGGDTASWRSRGPKTASFRRLAQHPELPISAGALYRCVALFELCDRLNAPSRWENLGASHLRAVLGLTPAAQEQMLAAANANRWTVKTFQHVILTTKPARMTRGGRRAQPLTAKTLQAVKKSVEDHRGAVDQMESMTEHELERNVLILEQARHCLEDLLQSMRSALNDRSEKSVSELL